jgi:hypothetical protein
MTKTQSTNRQSIGDLTRLIDQANEQALWGHVVASVRAWRAKLSIEAIRSWLKRRPRESLAFVISLLVHLGLFVALALLLLPLPGKVRSILVLPFDGTTMDLGTVEIAAATSESSVDSVVESSELSPSNTFAQTSDLTIASLSPQEKTPKTETSLIAQVEKTVQLDPMNGRDTMAVTPFAKATMLGRDIDGRRALALKNGGSVQSEEAVEAALKWLAAHQATNGSWSMDLDDAPCSGKCSQGTVEKGASKRVAGTGLALLCYLGAGHTHRKGDYTKVVEKGIEYLIDTLNGNGANSGIRGGAATPGRFLRQGGPYELYEQGIATLALCEALAMTKDTRLVGPCERSIAYVQESQAIDGSWGYHPHESGDLSIVGWQAMALKSACLNRVAVDRKCLEKMDRFLDTQSSDYGATFGYRGSETEPGTTAIGLLIKLFRGSQKSDAKIHKGAQYLVDLGPSSDGIYYNYYATQVLFHLDHPDWPNWNQLCRDYLIKEQAKNGHEAGSWSFGRNTFNRIGGRLYCTAMATLTLEVYYRYSPIYQEIEHDEFQL